MKNSERFHELADQYDRWYDDNALYFAAEVDAVRAFLPEGRGLEIGAGSGRFTEALGIETGLEPAARMRELALVRGVDLAAGYAEALPYGAGTFDYACFLTSLEFVSDQKKALREAARVLKPEGRLIIAYLNADSTEGQHLVQSRRELPAFEFASFLTPGSLGRLLSQTGFVPVAASFIVSVDGTYAVRPGSGDGLYTVVAAIRSVAS